MLRKHSFRFFITGTTETCNVATTMSCVVIFRSLGLVVLRARRFVDCDAKKSLNRYLHYAAFFIIVLFVALLWDNFFQTS